MFATLKISLLETERLMLEPLESSHAEELFPLLQDQDLHTYMEGDAPESIELLRKRYDFLSKRVSADGKQFWLNWVPRHRVSGECIGYFESSVEGDTAWLAYFVFKSFQKQGYAKEGMQEIRNFITAHYPVKTLVIEMDTRNFPSLLLAISLGFRWVKTTNKVANFKGNDSHEYRFEYSLEPGELKSPRRVADSESTWIELANEQDPLLLNEDQRFGFAQAALDHTFSQNVGMTERGGALKELLTELNERCHLNRTAIVMERLEHFKVSGARPQDYGERIFRVGDQGLVLAGIRWVGGKSEMPFVNIWPNFPLNSASDIDSLIALALTEFQVFSPKDISIWVNPESALVGELQNIAVPVRRYIFGRVQEIQKAKHPARYEELALVTPSKDEYFDWYLESYREFHATEPALRDWVPVNDKEEMEESRRRGLLFVVYVNGERAGLIAGQSRPILGLEALHFIEILLTKPFKGKGLASVAQRKYIDRLANNYEVVWGAIEAKNITSNKTAIKVGRRSIREEFFVRVP
jgi:ribosomal-protein-alanine N-acetyltransferase